MTDEKDVLIHRLSQRRYNAFLYLMADMHFLDNPMDRMSAINKHLGLKRMRRMKPLLHDFLDQVRDEKIEPLQALIVTLAILQWVKLEFNAALPPRARLDLPRLYEAAEEIAAGWGDDEEIVFTQMARAIATRKKPNPE